MTKRKSLLIAVFSFVIALCMTFIFGVPYGGESITAHAEAQSDGKTLISLVEATVAVPVAGETVSTTANTDNTLYKVSEVKWYDVAAEKDLNRYSKFAEGKQYTATVKFQVTGVTGYAFDKDNFVAKINGQSAEVVSVLDAFAYAKYTFTAIAEPLPKYTLTIENGTLENGDTSGEFDEGEKITVIAAAAPEGKVFVEWVIVSGDGYIYNESSENATFEMVESDATIKAVYKTIVWLVELMVKTPIAGEVADSNALSYPTDKGYTATLTWFDENWNELAENTKFALGVEYLVEIEVSVSGDFIFMIETTAAYLNGIEKAQFEAFPKSFEVVGSFIAAETPIEYFDVKVTDGRAEIDEDNVIKADSGKEITIIAEIPEGKEFEKWVVVSGGVTLADANSATTTFVMGSSSVEIKATFKDEPHVHDYGTLIAEKNATCSATGMHAHYVCSVCNKLFDESKNEKTLEDLVIEIDSTAHKYGEWKAEVPATTESAGTKAHKDCELCHKHFNAENTEISDEDLIIAKLPSGGDDTDTDNTDTDNTEKEKVSDKKGGIINGAIVGIVIGGVAVVGIGGFAILWFVIKKKSFADLIAAIKSPFKKK